MKFVKDAILHISSKDDDIIAGCFPINELNITKNNMFDKDFWKDYGVPLGLGACIESLRHNLASSCSEKTSFMKYGAGSIKSQNERDDYEDDDNINSAYYIGNEEHIKLQERVLGVSKNNTPITKQNNLSTTKQNKYSSNKTRKRNKYLSNKTTTIKKQKI